MTIYKNSSFEVFQSDTTQYSWPCEVIIDGNVIKISYEDGGEYVIYTGLEVEPGHYRLTADSVGGKATLHRFGDDDVFDGYWIEGGYEGMWRLTLDE
ncbi:hypothetical protein ACLBXM_13310 [Xanthobacteraceae bacterium A53D]